MADPAYFTVEEFRTAYPDTDEEIYTDERIEAERATAEQIIEGLDAQEGCHQAFVAREETLEVQGGTSRLAVPRYRIRSIDSIVIDDEEQDLAGLVLEGFAICGRRWPYGTIEVTVTHGWDVPPGRIKDAAMVLTNNRLVKGPLDDRAIGRIAPDGSVLNISVAGLRGAVTGIPEVDAAIAQYQKRRITPTSVWAGESPVSYASDWREGVWP